MEKIDTNKMVITEVMNAYEAIRDKLVDTVVESILSKLRQEIVLGSISIEDYNNSFGLSAESVCIFFNSFVDDMNDRIAYFYGEDGDFADAFYEFDTTENIVNYYYDCCSEGWDLLKDLHLQDSVDKTLEEEFAPKHF